MKRSVLAVLSLGLALTPGAASAFCGFYVAGGDAKLFNQSSQVVLVRDGDRTVLTMMSDYQGDPKQFAVVIPVPSVITKQQVHIGDPAIVTHLDQYSAPRLVEYSDPDPCPRAVDNLSQAVAGQAGVVARGDELHFHGGRAGEVKIEARYTVGEYDILILSATDSHALEAWLTHNGYRIPDGAAPILASYLKQNLHFFVAKVNLTEQAKLGFTRLRPIQVAFESPKFSLPLRLGMVNAHGPQDLVVYVLTQNGRVEAVNYRTLKMPSDVDVPEYVKDVFADFYRATFAEQWRQNDRQIVLTEYAWDMSWCDPCASAPLAASELQGLGVWWAQPDPRTGAPAPTFLTRLHLRYDRDHFPEDLVLQQTADRQNWQARYVLHHPWRGNKECPQRDAYLKGVRDRREREAHNLVELTAWRLDDVRAKMNVAADWSVPDENLR